MLSHLTPTIQNTKHKRVFSGWSNTKVEGVSFILPLKNWGVDSNHIRGTYDYAYICLRLFCLGMLSRSDKNLTTGWPCFYGILTNARNSNFVKIWKKKIAGTLQNTYGTLRCVAELLWGWENFSGNDCRGNQNTFSSNALCVRIVPVTNYKRYCLTRHAVEEPTQFGEKDDTCILVNEGRNTHLT